MLEVVEIDDHYAKQGVDSVSCQDAGLHFPAVVEAGEEDPTVNRLQQRAAEIFGRESAIFVPTGKRSGESDRHSAAYQRSMGRK